MGIKWLMYVELVIGGSGWGAGIYFHVRKMLDHSVYTQINEKL
jgi:hypothetical protein